MKCHVCAEPIEGAHVRLTFDGFPTLRLNGVSLDAHAGCVRLVQPDRGIALPEQEADLVTVSGDPGEWEARCRDHGFVAIKEERDDAHLAAAHHIARRHAA